MSDVYDVKITGTARLAEKIHSVTLSSIEIARRAAPGQFVHIKCGSSRLLRRPISICSVRDDEIRIVFEVKGEGTKWLAARGAGDTLNVLGPLGNGFSLSAQPDMKNIIVTGGGIGMPPLLFAAQSACCNVTAVLGFGSRERIILQDEFENICSKVMITTDDGSYGVCGTVVTPLEELLPAGGFDTVLTCGPYAMLKSVAALCRRYSVPCQVSMEERMGCGVGACLVCACRTLTDGVSNMSSVCADGPVFNAECVVWI